MKKLRTLRFGPAGIPLSTKKRSIIEGIKRVRELGLDAMELEFVRGVTVSEDKAPEVKKISEQYGVLLTCHAQYYINLNSPEEAKVRASVERLLKAARVAAASGAWSLCFHAAYYMKREPAPVYERVKKYLKRVVDTLVDEGYEIWIRPETTGKPTQLGSLEEILRLCEEVENCRPVIDWAHLHARDGRGSIRTKGDYRAVLEAIEGRLGTEVMVNLHVHYTPVEFSAKGEVRHHAMSEPGYGPDFKPFAELIAEMDLRPVIISESPVLDRDSILMKKMVEEAFRELGRRPPWPS